MKKYLCLLLIPAVVLTASCRMNTLKGEGNKTAIDMPVAPFKEVNSEIPVNITVNIQQGAQPGIRLSGYENVAKHIRATVKDNVVTLKTDLDEIWTIDSKDITVTITMPVINALNISGASDADIHGNLAGSDFKLDISGAGKVVIDNITVDTFSADISGACKLQVNGGSVKHASYELSGAGKIIAFPLQTIETAATISGAGTGEVSATQKLVADINGAGTIRYKGHPTVERDVSGVGTISDAN